MMRQDCCFLQRESCFVLRSRECDIFLWCCERYTKMLTEECAHRQTLHFYCGRRRNVSVEGEM